MEAIKNVRKNNFISIKSDKKYSVITITNWNSYNNLKNTEEQERVVERGLVRNTKNNVNNDKNIYMCEFEEFWKVYPARNGKKLEKGVALKIFQQFNPDEIPQVLLAAKNYAASKDVKEGIGIRDPKRFLKNAFWKDWLVNEKPEWKMSHEEYQTAQEAKK